jgi:selenocysteine lyase/cysteine desulfurase
MPPSPGQFPVDVNAIGCDLLTGTGRKFLRGPRAAALGARLRGQLAGLPGVTTHDLGRVRCAIVTAKIENMPAEEAATALGRAGVNVSATVPEHNPLNTEDRGVRPGECDSPRGPGRPVSVPEAPPATGRVRIGN